MARYTGDSGFGYKPRRYGLSQGLQGSNTRSPASYFGAGIAGSLLGEPGQTSPGMSTMSLHTTPEAGGTVAKPPASPSTPAKTNTPAAQSASSGGGAGPWVDPALGRTYAFNAMNREGARAQAIAARKQLAIDYGDASISGDLAGDTMTAEAARNNPFSVLAQLRKKYEQDAPKQLDESYNKSNLFFSGARAKGLGDLANEYQGQQYDVGGQARAALGQIDQGLLEALMAADYADMNAAWDQGYPRSGSDGAIDAPPTGNPVDPQYAGADVQGINDYLGLSPDYWQNFNAGVAGQTPYQAPAERYGAQGARSGEIADLPLLVPYNPNRNSDAQYDVSGLSLQPDGTYLGPTGLRYDRNGRRI